MSAEGELELQMPQLRNTAQRFISRVIPDMGMAIRTRPLEALIIGAYVRGLSDRDIESLLAEAGLGKVSRTMASRIYQELRARYAAFRELGHSVVGAPGAPPVLPILCLELCAPALHEV